MALIVDYPLSSTFAGVNSLQAMGIGVVGNAAPTGIPGSLIISGGAMVATLRDTDPETYTGQRAEITAPADPLGEHWYCFDFYIPQDFQTAGSLLSVMQMHDTPDGGDGGKFPNFLLTVEDERIGVYVPNTNLPAEGATSRRVGTAPLVKGEWLSGCLHVNWQPNNTGFREFFLNRVPLFREFNVGTHYVDAVGPYFKLGLYDAFHRGSFGSRTAMFRNVKIYSGNDGYQTVMGGTPLPTKQMLVL